MIIISKKQLIAMHHAIILRTGGSYGLGDKNMLETALASPFQTFDSQELFPSFEEKAARLGFGLVSNHAFIDGNKRIAAHTMLVLLELNGVVLTYSQTELINIFLELASGKASYSNLLKWILVHKAR